MLLPSLAPLLRLRRTLEHPVPYWLAYTALAVALVLAFVTL
jgi:hypothetical protein